MITFTPIIKTKPRAEIQALKETISLYSNSLIPYIEVTKNIDHRDVCKIEETLDSRKHFIEFIKLELNNRGLTTDFNLLEYLHHIEKYETLYPNKNIIYSIKINNFLADNSISYIIKVIEELHRKHFSIAIRYSFSFNFKDMEQILLCLDEHDYFIFDIGVDSYDAYALVIENFKSYKRKCKLIVFSDERPLSKSAKDFKTNGINNGFNKSVLEEIRKGTFDFDGFGSYCSAKNNLNEKGGPAKTFALLIIYNYSNNEFISIKGSKYDICPKVYGDAFKEELNLKYRSEIESIYFCDTPISLKMILAILDGKNKKSYVSNYIAVSIVHYIEEIFKNLL